MSDALVQFQEWLAQYPSWMVAGAGGFAIVVLVILLWKAMRIAIVALIIGGLIAGGWYLWEKFGKGDAPSTRSAPASTTP